MPETVPLHALYLGWFEEGIAGDIEYSFGDDGTDENELEVFLEVCRDGNAGCSIDDVRYLISRAESDLPNFVGYAGKLREIGDRTHCFQWIIDNVDDLCTSAGMKNALREVFVDPARVLNRDPAPSDHWLFDSIMILLRTETGKSDGYGYSKLGEETGFTQEISALAGTTIAPFLQRRKDLSPKLLEGISKVFADHLSRLGGAGVAGLISGTVSVVCAAIFKFQMMNYRLFNPIDWLVEKALSEKGVSIEPNARHDSFLSKEVSGAATSTRNIFRVEDGKVWIKCQSGYDGKIDKRKELCGRVGAMKFCYDAKELEDRHFLLVIDGFFDAEDIDLFETAGWDGVFYYDEVAELADHVEAFVSERVITIPDDDLPMAAEE